MRARTTCLIWLFFLIIVDILPVPVLGALLLYIILKRPPWFRTLVNRLYQEN